MESDSNFYTHEKTDSTGLDTGTVNEMRIMKPKTESDNDNKDLIAKLEARIAALEAKLSSNETIATPTAQKERIKAQQLIQISAEHNTRYTIAKAARLLFLFIITALIFGYEYYLYSDPEQNKLSQSAIERIDSMDIPYLYIYGSAMTNLSIPYKIEIQDGQIAPEKYHLNYIEYTKDLVYDNSFTNWTFIDITVDGGAEEAFLVPPFGQQLPVGSSLSIYIRSILYTDDFIDTDFDYKEELLHKLADGSLYGLYWDIGPISDIYDIENTKKRYIDQWQQLQFTFIATINMYYIDLFEEINKINNTNEAYYTATLVASILNEDELGYNYVNHWWYTTKLTLYPNPTGGGLKTTLTITQKTTFTDVLANVGGIFSPLNTFTFLVLLWTVFGIHAGRFSLHGVAPLSSLNYQTRQQIKMYLVHLGVISDDTLHVEEHNIESKMMDVLSRTQY